MIKWANGASQHSTICMCMAPSSLVPSKKPPSSKSFNQCTSLETKVGTLSKKPLDAAVVDL